MYVFIRICKIRWKFLIVPNCSVPFLNAYECVIIAYITFLTSLSFFDTGSANSTYRLAFRLSRG